MTMTVDLATARPSKEYLICCLLLLARILENEELESRRKKVKDMPQYTDEFRAK